MFDETPVAARNVVSFADARAQRQTHVAQPLRARLCGHCGAALGEGESEEECSGAGFGGAMAVAARRRGDSSRP